MVEGAFTDTKRSMFTSEDICFTAKDGVLYAAVLKWPEDGRVIIKSLASGFKYTVCCIKSVELLGCTTPLKWSCNGQGLAIDASLCTPSKYAAIFKISTNGCC